MDATSNRLVQEKQTNANKAVAGQTSRRSASPTDENKPNGKKQRATGNVDVREWDLPKFHQQEKETLANERQVIEEQAG
jgi:hypothetical protein